MDDAPRRAHRDVLAGWRAAHRRPRAADGRARASHGRREGGMKLDGVKQGGGMAGKVVVVGSANVDLVVDVPRHPAGGETILGGELRRSPGGKGANQAVAAARAGGADTTFVGALGRDESADLLLASLGRSG